MSKTIVVLMNWIHMVATVMASFAHNIATKMSPSNVKIPDTPTPPVTPQQMDDAADRLELAYATRMNGAEAKTEYENADTALNELLHEHSEYVNTVANGDKVIIEAFGFTATSNDRKKAVVPATPAVPKIWGNAAELHLQIAGVPGAISYCWVIFTGGDAKAGATVAETHIVLSCAAIVIPDGTTREILRGVIAAGTTIGVQVLAQNSAGKSGFSPLINFTAGS